MTAEIINLNKVRKARARAEKERRAEENRMRHGRTRAERDAADASHRLAESRLDGAHRSGDDPGSIDSETGDSGADR